MKNYYQHCAENANRPCLTAEPYRNRPGVRLR